MGVNFLQEFFPYLTVVVLVCKTVKEISLAFHFLLVFFFALEDAPGSRQVDLWGHEAGDQAPGADPELAAASLASPPVLQPNQEGIKHIKDPLNIFIGSVSGALNQILFFKSIWADGLKQGLDQRSEAQGSHGLCAEPSLSVPYRSNLRSGWKHRACLKPLQKCVLRNKPKNSFPAKS